MTQQLLHYLDICFSCRQQGRIRVPERVPSDVLCDSDLHCSGADKTPHDWLAPNTVFCRTLRDSQISSHQVFGKVCAPAISSTLPLGKHRAESVSGTPRSCT